MLFLVPSETLNILTPAASVMAPPNPLICWYFADLFSDNLKFEVSNGFCYQK
jgi:hypothetical protein